jgi:hypothetical protein
MQVNNDLLNKFAKLVDNYAQEKETKATELYGKVTAIKPKAAQDEYEYYTVELNTGSADIPKSKCQCIAEITSTILVGNDVLVRIEDGVGKIIKNLTISDQYSMAIVYMETAAGSFTPIGLDPNAGGYYTGIINMQHTDGVIGWDTYSEYLSKGFKPSGLSAISLLSSVDGSEFDNVIKDLPILPTTSMIDYQINDTEIQVTYGLGGAASHDNRKFKVALMVVMMRADLINE